MEDKSHAIIAVIFLIIFAVGATTIYMWLHRGPKEDRYYDIVSSYAVGGLQPEAAVKFKGLRVGNVKKITFDPKDPEKVLIRIAVFPDAYITHATYAQLASKGITGMSYIKLVNTAGGSTQPLATTKAHPARIPMHRGLLDSLEHTGTATFKQLNHIVKHFDQWFNKDNRQHLSATLKHLDQASARLVVLERQLTTTVKAMPGLEDQARQLMKSSQSLEKSIGRLANQAHKPVKALGDTAKSVTHLSQSSDALVHRINEELLPKVDRLVRRMNNTVGQINQITRQLNAQPQSLIFGPGPGKPGPGEPGFHPPSKGH